MFVDISKLKINDLHKQIYQINDIEDLKESILESGQLVPIIVDPQWFILSGVRRLEALKQLNYTQVDVQIMNVKQGDELLTLISFNKQRNKTMREKHNESKFLKEIWGKRRGRKSLEDKLLNGKVKPADTRKDICKGLSISAGNLVKLDYIDKHRSDLIEAIDKGDISINQAHESVKKFEEQKVVVKPLSTLPTTITNDWYTIFNESSDNLSKLEDESIQTIFTSPPYWQKRNFMDVEDELGSEATSEEFVQRMANHLHACHRVLKPSGSFFLNMGDTYHEKSLQCIPSRIAFELMKKGWCLRNQIIWHKTNPMPTSTKDSLKNTWEFIFHLTKESTYDYYPLSLPKQTGNKSVDKIFQRYRNNGKFSVSTVSVHNSEVGKKLGDFWPDDIVTTATANQSAVKKYGGIDHPAVFPTEIVTLPILQTSKPGDTILDVFSGTSTVGEIAILLGRRFVGYEFNPNHNNVQKGRLDDAVKAYNSSKIPDDWDELRQAA
jgi:site-specific DNA-methyltransferase (adenine-specific)